MAASRVPETVPTPVTAAQRALALPEILCNIFSQKPHAYFTHTQAEQWDMLQFALVNRSWYEEAIRVLWARPILPIDQVMAKVPPNRRQHYANLVHTAQVTRHSRVRKDPFERGGSLHGLVFPRMTQLFVNIFTTDLYVIPLDHPDDWARDMYFKRREPKSRQEVHLDSLFQVISNLVPGIDELFLRYKGPISNLTGLVEIPAKARASPAANMHWYIDQSPTPSCSSVSSTDEDESHESREPEEEVIVDPWGQSLWAEVYLSNFDPDKYNLGASSLSALNAE